MTSDEVNQRVADGTIDVISRSGRTLYFSTKTFVEKIAGGSLCFICGADPATESFNEEHIIPDWILSRYNLHSRRITIPNEAGLRYDRCKVQCCEKCNSQMSEVFESPISNLVKQGYNALVAQMRHDPWMIFCWLALIYLKMHLKDRHLRFHLDRRKGEDTIADLYDWRDFHHAHCLARAHYTGVLLEPQVLGSILVWPARSTGEEEFDYVNSYLGNTVLLQLGEIAFIAILNDSGAVQALMQDDFERMSGPLSSIQLRELMVRMAHTNIHLRKRPKQHSRFENLYYNPALPDTLLSNGKYTISADLPEELAIDEVPPATLGKMLAFYLKGSLDPLIPSADRDKLIADLSDGEHSLIFNGQKEYLTNPPARSGEIARAVRLRFSEAACHPNGPGVVSSAGSAETGEDLER